MNLEGKRSKILEALKIAHRLEDKRKIVTAVLELIRDGYQSVEIKKNDKVEGAVTVANKCSVEEKFLIAEMDYYLSQLKESSND